MGHDWNITTARQSPSPLPGDIRKSVVHLHGKGLLPARHAQAHRVFREVSPVVTSDLLQVCYKGTAPWERDCRIIGEASPTLTFTVFASLGVPEWYRPVSPELAPRRHGPFTVGDQRSSQVPWPRGSPHAREPFSVMARARL